MIRDEEIIKEKLQFYKDKNEAIHLTLKSNNIIERPFRNGLTKEIKLDSIVFNDERLGIIFIHLSEIIDIQKREFKR